LEGKGLRGEKTKNIGVFLMFLILGGIIGGILGELIADSSWLSGIAPYVVKKFLIFDMAPFTINLFVLKLKFGLELQPNLISILGMVIAILLFRKF